MAVIPQEAVKAGHRRLGKALFRGLGFPGWFEFIRPTAAIQPCGGMLGELRIFAVAHGGIPHGPSQQFLGGGLPGFDDLGVNALSPVFPNL